MTTSRHRRERAFFPILIGVVLYLVGLLLFYPDVPTVVDEVNYLEPAVGFAQGADCLETRDPFSGDRLCAKRSYYLPGTAALMTPFVVLFGWRGAYLVPALCLAITVMVTARWLQESGRSPRFALLVLGFPPALVFGRVAMSDLPSAALVATGLWLFFRGARSEARAPWLASGFLAGASAALRETNVLLFAPLYLGALLRRDRGVGLLVAGGLAGLTLRSLGSWLFFGDPFYRFPLVLEFGLRHVPPGLLLFGLYLLVYVPGGLIGALAYRGERRPEVLATVAAFVSVFLLLNYKAEESGLLKQIVLGPRYLIPLVPLLAFACAESFPRFARAARERLAAPVRKRFDRGLALMIGLWSAVVLLAAFAVHAGHARWSATQASIRRGIYAHTPTGSLVVVNDLATRKFVNHVFGERMILDRERLSDDDLRALLVRHGELYAAFLDRNDSELWRDNAAGNARFVERLGAAAQVEQLYEAPGGPGERLRVWRVSRAPSPTPRPPRPAAPR